MPELPEVETVRILLEQYVVGQHIQSVTVKTPSIITGDIQSLVGKNIGSIRRFSKLLVIDANNLSIAIHLKMTGRLVFEPNLQQKKEQSHLVDSWEYDYKNNPHTHVTFHFTSGAQLYFNDYRRFGTIHVLESKKLEELHYIKYLGKEFYKDLTVSAFQRILLATHRAIKTVLLDQTKIGGVGNIYANEGLWRAYIHPSTPANTLSAERGHALHTALEEVMKEALSHGGASSDNFRDLFSRRGSAQKYFCVYGKEGNPCLRCKTPIQKFFLAGRGTFFCPKCQKKN